MIDKGSYIRKKNWGFFKNTFIDGTPEFVPSIHIVTIYQNKPDTVIIHGEMYPIDSLVEISEQQSTELNMEFHSMKLSDPELQGEWAHTRKDNGNVKVSQEYGYALRLCFTTNHKDPENKITAYRCPVCGDIHCGAMSKVVIDSVGSMSSLCNNGHTFSKAMKQPFPRLCVHCGVPEEITIASLKKKIKVAKKELEVTKEDFQAQNGGVIYFNELAICERHVYSKTMNQPYPRLCINCKKPEPQKQ